MDNHTTTTGAQRQRARTTHVGHEFRCSTKAEDKELCTCMAGCSQATQYSPGVCPNLVKKLKKTCCCQEETHDPLVGAVTNSDDRKRRRKRWAKRAGGRVRAESKMARGHRLYLDFVLHLLPDLIGIERSIKV